MYGYVFTAASPRPRIRSQVP